MRLWRPLLMAAVLGIGVLASRAEAQTFIVKGAPDGSNVELVMAGKPVATGAPDRQGDVRLATTLTSRELPEIVVHISIDACGTMHRIVLAERTAAVPPPGVGCTRNDINGNFVLRRVTSLVIDIAKTSPTVLISQGPPPPEWVKPNRRVIDATLPGLTLGGGVSFAGFRDVVGAQCGNIRPCKATDYRPSYSLGARYWIGKYLAADVGYIRSGDTTSEGAGVGQAPYTFKSSFNTRIFTLAAAFGGPFGRIRLYGRAGMNRQDAVTTNDQATEEITIIEDDESLIHLKGGTNSLVHRTAGVGLLFGVGGEFWVSPPFGFYVEGSLAYLKGKDQDGGEAKLDDRTYMILAGGRVYLGRIFTGRFLR